MSARTGTSPELAKLVTEMRRAQLAFEKAGLRQDKSRKGGRERRGM
jgi:hypothetical protein